MSIIDDIVYVRYSLCGIAYYVLVAMCYVRCNVYFVLRMVRHCVRNRYYR